MKQYIVLIGMIGLGIFLFSLILGPGDDSVAHDMGVLIKEAMGAGMT